MQHLTTKLGMALLVMMITTGCATKKPVQFRLDCRSNQPFERCGEVFDTRNHCAAALNEMVRTSSSARSRGTCIRN